MTKGSEASASRLGLTYPRYHNTVMVALENDGITVGDVSNRLLTDPGSVAALKRLE
jgi:hypothetical protein